MGKILLTYNCDQPLISIHIPKCAGSSFNLILRKWFKRKLYLHYPIEKKNKPPKKFNIYTGFFKNKLKKNICIHGHFNQARGNGPDQYYPEVEQFITFIRDPFEIHLSTYFFIQKSPENRFRNGKPHPIIKNELSLEEYLEKHPKSYLLKFFPSNLNENNFEECLSTKYVYIGITEDLQTSVNTLASKLNFPEAEVPTENISPRKEKVPRGSRERFLKNNQLEYAIYNYAAQNYKN